MRPRDGGMGRKAGVSIREILTKERWWRRLRLYGNQKGSEREGEEIK